MSGQDRYRRLQAIRAEVADKLELPITDDRVTVAASLRLHHETLTEHLIAARVVDTGDLLRTSELILQACPEIAEPHRLVIEFVHPTQTKCPKCAHEFDPDSPNRTVMLPPAPEPVATPSRPEPPLPPSRPPPAAASAADTGDKPKPFSKQPPSADVVPIRRSIHDGGGPG